MNIYRLLYGLKFFTTWMAIMAIFHKQINKYISLSFLAFVVMVAGLYLSYINPGKFVVYDVDKRVEITGGYKFLGDIVFHIGVFLFIYFNYGIEPIWDLRVLSGIILLFIYSLIIDINKVYEIKYFNMYVLGIFICAAYVIIGIIQGVY